MKKDKNPLHPPHHDHPDYHPHHHHHHHYPVPDCPECPPCPPPDVDKYERDALRLEAVTVCVGFDDLLDFAITHNHPHLDTLIVVTAHDDYKTQQVCQKHGVICVPTDLVKKNSRNFNKGAAINAGFNRFQYFGWRLHLDSDALLPDNFRRLLFNHTCLKRDFIYGADRIDVIGKNEADAIKKYRQHNYGFLIYSEQRKQISARYVDGLNGYVPIGFFQMWHSSKQVWYPFSLGSAAHDDIAFAMLWPECNRMLLTQVIFHHLITDPKMKFGANWDGRTQPRIDGKK